MPRMKRLRECEVTPSTDACVPIAYEDQARRAEPPRSDEKENMCHSADTANDLVHVNQPASIDYDLPQTDEPASIENEAVRTDDPAGTDEPPPTEGTQRKSRRLTKLPEYLSRNSQTTYAYCVDQLLRVERSQVPKKPKATVTLPKGQDRDNAHQNRARKSTGRQDHTVEGMQYVQQWLKDNYEWTELLQGWTCQISYRAGTASGYRQRDRYWCHASGEKFRSLVEISRFLGLPPPPPRKKPQGKKSFAGRVHNTTQGGEAQDVRIQGPKSINAINRVPTHVCDSRTLELAALLPGEKVAAPAATPQCAPISTAKNCVAKAREPVASVGATVCTPSCSPDHEISEDATPQRTPTGLNDSPATEPEARAAIEDAPVPTHACSPEATGEALAETLYTPEATHEQIHPDTTRSPAVKPHSVPVDTAQTHAGTAEVPVCCTGELVPTLQCAPASTAETRAISPQIAHGGTGVAPTASVDAAGATPGQASAIDTQPHGTPAVSPESAPKNNGEAPVATEVVPVANNTEQPPPLQPAPALTVQAYAIAMEAPVATPERTPEFTPDAPAVNLTSAPVYIAQEPAANLQSAPAVTAEAPAPSTGGQAPTLAMPHVNVTTAEQVHAPTVAPARTGKTTAHFPTATSRPVATAAKPGPVAPQQRTEANTAILAPAAASTPVAAAKLTPAATAAHTNAALETTARMATAAGHVSESTPVATPARAPVTALHSSLGALTARAAHVVMDLQSTVPHTEPSSDVDTTFAATAQALAAAASNAVPERASAETFAKGKTEVAAEHAAAGIASHATVATTPDIPVATGGPAPAAAAQPSSAATAEMPLVHTSQPAAANCNQPVAAVSTEPALLSRLKPTTTAESIPAPNLQPTPAATSPLTTLATQHHTPVATPRRGTEATAHPINASTPRHAYAATPQPTPVATQLRTSVAAATSIPEPTTEPSNIIVIDAEQTAHKACMDVKHEPQVEPRKQITSAPKPPQDTARQAHKSTGLQTARAHASLQQGKVARRPQVPATRSSPGANAVIGGASRGVAGGAPVACQQSPPPMPSPPPQPSKPSNTSQSPGSPQESDAAKMKEAFEMMKAPGMSNVVMRTLPGGIAQLVSELSKVPFLIHKQWELSEGALVVLHDKATLG